MDLLQPKILKTKMKHRDPVGICLSMQCVIHMNSMNLFDSSYFK